MPFSSRSPSTRPSSRRCAASTTTRAKKAHVVTVLVKLEECVLCEDLEEDRIGIVHKLFATVQEEILRIIRCMLFLLQATTLLHKDDHKYISEAEPLGKKWDGLAYESWKEIRKAPLF